MMLDFKVPVRLEAAFRDFSANFLSAFEAHRMASFRLELDKPNNIVLAIVTEDDDSDHDYQFDFDSKTGRWEFAERDLLERDFGDDWVEEFEEAVNEMIREALA